MEALTKLVISVSCLALVWTVCDLALPDGRLRDAARFVVGLVVMLALVQPIAGLFSILPEQVARSEAHRMDTALMQAQARAYQQDDAYVRAVLDAYARGAEEIVRAMALEAGFSDPEAVVTLTDRGEIFSVLLREGAVPVFTTAKGRPELQKAIAERLSVPPDIVQIR